MRKAKSRNFLLVVCGVFMALLLGLVVAKTFVAILDDINNADDDEKINSNLITSSSKIKIKGKGNFINNTPIIEKTAISNYNVRVSEKGDFVYYSVVLCNMNNFDLRLDRFIVEGLTCNNSVNCDGVFVDTYVSDRKDKLDIGDIISANSCVNLIIETKYEDDNSNIINVSIDRVFLDLVKDKK